MRRIIPVLLMLCLLLGGCTARDPIAPVLSPLPEGSHSVPSSAIEASVPQESVVTLWFRFGNEPMLAPEIRTIDVSPAAPFELTLLQALTNGPAAASTDLSGLFPPGTRVLATHLQGRTLFVTLSRQIMNDFADEPDNWTGIPAWAEEVTLRRRLAMQAIAATVTENCDVDQVVILVEQTSSGNESIRLRQQYYRTGADAAALAEPLLRDERPLLTPANTMAIILDNWMRGTWAGLYPYIARTDAFDGAARPDYETFRTQADALPYLMDYSASSGSISPDGQTAVFAVTLQLLDNGQPREAHVVLRLHRERGIWRISLSHLTGMEGNLP